MTGLLLILAGLMVSAQAQGNPTVVIDPASAQVDVGSTVEVDLRVEGVTGLAYVDLMVMFDTSLLDVVDADAATDGVQIEPGTLLGTIEFNEVYTDDGEIYLEASGGPFSGDGVVATITFRGKAAGTSAVTIDTSYSYLEDDSEDPISFSTQNGSIVVGEAATTITPSASPTMTVTYTPTPTATSTLTQTLTPSPTSATQTPATQTPATQTPETPTPSASPSPTPTPSTTPASGPTAESSPSPSPSPRPSATPGYYDLHVLQVWPDRSVGVASSLLGDATSYADTDVLPFGLFYTPSGGAVRAHTYLDFPLEIFSPGTYVLRATLYVFVDSSSDAGEAAFGAYRVLETWKETGWVGDPATWPALLNSPIAVAETRFDLVDPSQSMLPGTAILASKPAGHARSSRLTDDVLIQTPSSPLPTPTLEPTSTSTPTPTPTLTPEPTSASTETTATSTPAAAETTATATLTPLPTSVPAADVSETAFEQVEGKWVTWDVTALMRAWLAGEVEDYGLALAAATGCCPGASDNLLVARMSTADDPDTAPYMIVSFEIHPVTPTPTATPVPLLPPAGSAAGWQGLPLLIAGAVLLLLGLAIRRRLA